MNPLPAVENLTSTTARRPDSHFTGPKKYPYSFRSLRLLPRRIFRPPAAPVEKVKMVGSVRSFSLTPAYNVKIEDILAGKHLPPLTLRDFEEWLLHVEYSAENLYFLQWLKDYSDPKRRKNATSTQLALSLARCKETFFTAGAPLELNLTYDIKHRINPGTTPSIHNGQSPGTSNRDDFSMAYDPQLFDAAKEAVEELLTASLMKYVLESSGNADLLRRFFAICVGVATIAVGFAPVLLSVLRGNSRWIRLSAFPVFWFGSLCVLGGFCRVCIVIFLFGDARQLHGYELARPSFTPIINTASEAFHDSPHDQSEYDLGDKKHDLESQTQSPTSAFNFPISTQHDKNDDASSTKSSNQIASPPHVLTEPSRPELFDFDNLGVSPQPYSISPEPSPSKFSTPMFGPLTKVLSPIITRAQWEIVVKSSAWSVLFAIVLGTACLALPFRDGRHHGDNW